MKLKTKLWPGLVLLILSAASAAAQKGTQEWFVADKMVDCAEGAAQKCFVVRDVRSADWKYFSGAIRGFRFRDGYTQRIRVAPRPNAAADDSAARDFRLVKTISRSHTAGNTIEEAQRQMQNQTSLSLGGKQWRITEIEGAAVETDKATMEFDTAKKRMGAKICNGMGGSYELNGANLKFSRIIGTLMACEEPLNSIEARFQKAVEKVTRAEQRGDELTLLAGDVVVMKLTAGSGGGAANDRALAGRPWTVHQIEGETITLKNRAPFLQFDHKLMRYTGFSGCNRLLGKYETGGGDALKLSGGAMTRMACLDSERRRLENRMTEALARVNRHEIKDGVLRLYEGEKLLLTLAAEN